VFDPNAPSSKLALAELGDKALREKLLKYGVWRTDSEADAEDLLANAIECVCDPDRRPWDPAKGTFFRHMRAVMDRIAIHATRRGAGRFEVADEGITFGEGTVDRQPLADEALHQGRKLAWLRRMGTVLLERLDRKDPLAAKVFRAAFEGVEEPQEQAERIGCPIEDVYEALRRIRYRAAKIRAEDEQAQAERMKQARSAAKEDAVQ
jgi:DNA-directed RNA polymerase specialized sigma24 family protein